ncbi:MAG: hypothetical protein IJN25_00155 [Clostridia bacterium]|nr:hypothetical protein [Clostridia bacterium]MBQ7032064.1 hypothetical protein [Clostridia bacterium]
MAKDYKIDFNEYSFTTEEGTFSGKLDFKMFGKKQNILAYITLDNGEKVIAAAYKDNDYYGLRDIEPDSLIEVTFTRSNSGMIRLSAVNLI